MGQTALDLALTMSESIAAMLLDQDAREGLGGDIKDACDLGDTELLRALIAGIDPDFRSPWLRFGPTAIRLGQGESLADGLFSYAEKSGNVEILKYTEPSLR